LRTLFSTSRPAIGRKRTPPLAPGVMPAILFQVKRAVHHSAVWLVAPLWFLFVAISFGRVAILIHYNHDFEAHARQTEGVVLKKVERVVDQFSGARIYVLVYRYDADNVRQIVRTGVDPETFERVKVGGPIPILYLPGDSRTHCLDYPWELADLAWIPFDDFVVGMLVFIPGVFLIWHFGRRNFIHARLQKTGVRTWSEVTALRKSHYRCNSDTYLIFNFTTDSGRVITGRSPSVTSDDYTHWKMGDFIEVLYDPKRPGYFSVDLRHPFDGLFPKQQAPRIYETIWS
jgi:hypothetical protein